MCPKCGEIFNQSGYRVIVRDFFGQKDAQIIEEEKEALTVEPREENETKFDMIPDLELGEDEKMQSQSSRDTEVFVD